MNPHTVEVRLETEATPHGYPLSKGRKEYVGYGQYSGERCNTQSPEILSYESNESVRRIRLSALSYSSSSSPPEQASLHSLCSSLAVALSSSLSSLSSACIASDQLAWNAALQALGQGSISGICFFFFSPPHPGAANAAIINKNRNLVKNPLIMPSYLFVYRL